MVAVVTQLVTAGEFFIVITAELVLLFIGISFLVGLLQEYVSEERIRRTLTTRHRITGTALGAVFGALTPFCSCSTIPVLVGLIKTKVPFSTSMAYLFSSPLLNPIIVFLVLAFIGPLPTLLYCVLTFSIAVLSGIILERGGYERFIKPIVHREPAPSSCCSQNPQPAPAAASACCGDPAPLSICCGEGTAPSLHHTRVRSAFAFAFDLFRDVLPYLILGAGIGAFIYGFVPEDLIVSLAGTGNPFAIPVAAVIGIPMYVRAETIIPISAALVTKGMGIGAVMALIIGGSGASIPELTLLLSLFERRLIVAFVVTILMVAIITGVAVQLLQLSGVIA